MSERLRLFLDSASLDDARAARDLGFVEGITTNPSLLAREGRPAEEQLEALLEAFPGVVFFQPVWVEPDEAAEAIRRVASDATDRVVGKLPALPSLFPVAARLTQEGIACAMTAVYSPGQAIVAAASGARWVIPYVNRAKRLTGSEDLVQDLWSVLDGRGDRPGILAASIKSIDEMVQAFVDGADAVSAPLALLEELGEHALTRSAVDGFTQDAEAAGLQ
jgi:transaldolase